MFLFVGDADHLSFKIKFFFQFDFVNVYRNISTNISK